MKAETEKTGFFKRLFAAVFSNWGLKLLALALAIVIYHSLKKESDSSNDSSQDTHDRHIFQYH